MKTNNPKNISTLKSNGAGSATTALVVDGESALELGEVGDTGTLQIESVALSLGFKIASATGVTLDAATTWANDKKIAVVNMDPGSRGASYGEDQLAFYPIDEPNQTTNSDNACSFIIAQSLATYASDGSIQSGQDYSNQTNNLELVLSCSHGHNIVSQCQSYVLCDGLLTIQADGQCNAVY